MNLQNAHLILFLTEGTRLSDWHQSGLLGREAELYLRLRPHLGSISWVIYGGAGDLAYQDSLPGIQLLPNRWRLPNQVYIQHLPWLHAEAFRRAHVLKAEQTGAAQAALTVARHYGKTLIARSGFSLDLFARYAPQDYEIGYQRILELEREAFSYAGRVVVTTEEMRQTALTQHPGLGADKIRVIPNYVNTERFCPAAPPPTDDPRPLILFIGRLTAQKNPLAILEALAPMKNYRVHLIGEGDLRPALEARIQAEGLDHIRLLGNVPSQDLPQHLQAATLYLQPSLYEGHPKTIFEAMACGLPVLTSRVPGVQQFISHGETGYLCQTDPQSIREGVEILLADAPLRAHLGAAARSYVQQHLSLERVLALELEVLAETLAISPPPAQPRPRPWLASARTYGSRVWTVARRKLGGQ